VALSVAQFAQATNSAAATQAVTISATQAGDFIVCLGIVQDTVTINNVTTDKGDTGVFQKVNGAVSPIHDTIIGGAAALYYFVNLIAPTAGTTVVTIHYSGGAQTFDDLEVYVVRGAANLVLDKSVSADTTAATLAKSGLTGTLSAAIELAIGYNVTGIATTGVDTGQTGSAGFVGRGVNSNGNECSDQLTSATTSLQAAFDQTSGNSITLCSTFFDSGPALMGQAWV
jgi:hypothetical protein